ncbi:hypothetical protein ACFE04_011192 [Oxalis oulophora]
MAPPPQQPPQQLKTYFFYGHRNRNPSQHRPTVRGGPLTNRRHKLQTPQTTKHQPFNINKWDPHFINNNTSNPQIKSTKTTTTTTHHQSLTQLSPIARFIISTFRKNNNKWTPQVISELQKLRRVTNTLVAEVVKLEKDPTLASKFFHWAGKQKGYTHNYASYNAYAYNLNRCNLYRGADQLPELMYSQGKAPSEKQFEILIRMHADSNRGLRVYYVYQKMKKFGVKPRTFLYNRIMDALVRNGYMDLALNVYQDFKDDGLKEESVTYMILIKGLCKAGRIDEMMDVLGKMRENLCKPDVFAYTAMIKVLVGEDNLDACLQVWDEMKRDRVEPDVMAYVTLVTGLCKGRNPEKGYELFKEMKKKGILVDRAIYTVLVEGFVKDRKIGTALDLLKDLIDSGYRADLGIYNSLIEGLCSVNRVDKAYKLFQVTVQEELEPDFVTVSPILVCYAETREMNDFCKLLEHMGKLGFSVIDELSKFFTSFLEKNERINIALEVFEDLKAKGYSSVPIYNTLMETLLNDGEVKKALSLYNEMKNPDSLSYSIAISCFVENGDIHEACTCHNKIIEMACVPTVSAYRSLAKGLCKSGEIDSAMMLVRDCLASVPSGPTEFKYSLTVVHVCKSGDSEKIIEVINEMMHEGCRPDEVIYCAIIHGCCKHEKLEVAKRVFSSLRGRKLLREADMIVYEEMLIDHMKKQTADLVLAGLKFFRLESKLKAKGKAIMDNASRMFSCSLCSAVENSPSKLLQRSSSYSGSQQFGIERYIDES